MFKRLTDFLKNLRAWLAVVVSSLILFKVNLEISQIIDFTFKYQLHLLALIIAGTLTMYFIITSKINSYNVRVSAEFNKVADSIERNHLNMQKMMRSQEVIATRSHVFRIYQEYKGNERITDPTVKSSIMALVDELKRLKINSAHEQMLKELREKFR